MIKRYADADICSNKPIANLIDMPSAGMKGSNVFIVIKNLIRGERRS